MTPPSSLSLCLVLPCFQRRDKRRQLLQSVLCSDQIQQSPLQKWENLHQWQTTGKYSYCCLVAVYGDKSGHVLCCFCHNYIKKKKRGTKMKKHYVLNLCCRCVCTVTSGGGPGPLSLSLPAPTLRNQTHLRPPRPTPLRSHLC